MAAKIISTGSYLPSRVVKNKELAECMNTSDQWIQDKIGIQERRFVSDGEGVSDLALKSSRKALDRVGLSPNDLDAIVFATSTPEYMAPGSAILLQDKLGCSEIMAVDIRNTSPGFLYALDVADGLVASARYETVLVVGAETHSRVLDFSDRGRMMSVIFGDGAGCVILQKSSEQALKQLILRSDGSQAKKLWCEAPTCLEAPPISQQMIEDGRVHPQMDGRTVFSAAVKNMSQAFRDVMLAEKIGISDITHFVSHQANLRIIEAIGKELNLEESQVPTVIEKYGNISSASIPVVLDELNDQGKLQKDQLIGMVSFGSGFTWGAGLIQV